MTKKTAIPFNKPYISGNEVYNIYQAIYRGKLSGNGHFTQQCQSFFQQRYGFKKCLLTTSCTSALEMAAMLCEIKSGDEVIVPSYTFVSTALAFARQGAEIIFADSRKDRPGLDESSLEQLITPKTKAIVVVHYAGIACDMDLVMDIAGKYGIKVIEDAAQSIDAFYKGRPLGSIGNLSCFSFHETKNIQAGEGGMLVINDESLIRRAEILWEKGTNRVEFHRGDVQKYEWVDMGSSFLPSELIAAYLFAQLENIDEIQSKRVRLWDKYYQRLSLLQEKSLIKLPLIPAFATNNAHMFFILCNSLEERTRLITFLSRQQVMAVFHYLALHKSPYYLKDHMLTSLEMSEYYENHLLRLPLFNEMQAEEIDTVCDLIYQFYSV